jgi:hypothetical protein
MISVIPRSGFIIVEKIRLIVLKRSLSLRLRRKKKKNKGIE